MPRRSPTDSSSGPRLLLAACVSTMAVIGVYRYWPVVTESIDLPPVDSSSVEMRVRT